VGKILIGILVSFALPLLTFLSIEIFAQKSTALPYAMINEGKAAAAAASSSRPTTPKNSERLASQDITPGKEISQKMTQLTKKRFAEAFGKDVVDKWIMINWDELTNSSLELETPQRRHAWKALIQQINSLNIELKASLYKEFLAIKNAAPPTSSGPIPPPLQTNQPNLLMQINAFTQEKFTSVFGDNNISKLDDINWDILNNQNQDLYAEKIIQLDLCFEKLKTKLQYELYNEVLEIKNDRNNVHTDRLKNLIKKKLF